MLAAAAVASASAIAAIETEGDAPLALRLLAASALGIPLFIALSLSAEERAWTGARRLALMLGGTAVLAAFAAAWPGWSDTMRGLRIAQLAIAFALMIAVLPLAGRDRPGAFWEFNRRLLVRFVISGIASGTFYAGLALALGALKMLFNVDVPGTAWARLWVLMAFLFNTWFFLGGLPTDLTALEEQRAYPPALKVFAQFILVPLVSIYLVILTVYLAKVVVTRDWPSGWIGWLVSGVATVGILALLLVQPLAEREDQRWIALFARDFWIALLPAVVMLWLAIYQRVHQYGITEARYFLAVLSLWLAGIALFFTISRSRQIRVIPASLCVVALMTFVGPWSAYAVSARNQVGRLREIVARNGSRAAGRPMAFADSREASAIVRYLLEVHGARPLVPLLPAALQARAEHLGRSDQASRELVEALGATYVDRWTRSPGLLMRFDFTRDARAPIDVRGYDVLLTLGDDPAPGDTALSAQLSGDRKSVEVRRGKDVIVAIGLDSMLAALPLREDASRHRPNGMLPPERLRAAGSGAAARGVVWFRTVAGNFNPRARSLTNATGDVLLTLTR